MNAAQHRLSSRTWARSALGPGFAVRDPLFLARKLGASVELSSKCPKCARWGSLSRPAASLRPPSFDPRREPSRELLHLVRRLRCQGCGIRPFEGAETITVKRPKPKPLTTGKEKRGGTRLQGQRRL